MTVTTRTLIKNLVALEDSTVSVSGWVDKVRDQKAVQFVILRDESGAVQLVAPRGDTAEDIQSTISALTVGSFVTVTGQLKHDERVKLGGIEVKLETVDVASAALADN